METVVLVIRIITVIELPEGTEQNHNTSVSIVGLQAEIRTRNLPNTYSVVFLSCIVNYNHPYHQQMLTIYMKSQIVNTRTFLHASFSGRHNTTVYKPAHVIYIYGVKNKVLKVLNTGSHKDKNVDKIDNVVLTCF